MRITHLYMLLIFFGGFIYFEFSSQEVKKLQFNEVAQVDFLTFKIYEISTKGVDRVLIGERGKRFSNRYEIEKAELLEQRKILIENIKSNTALYKGDTIYLKGDVVYLRQDGLEFRSNDAQYNKVDMTMSTDGEFFMQKNRDVIYGNRLYYNRKDGKMSAQNVRASVVMKKG